MQGEVAIGLPVKTELMQNYPNPFNPSTVISYSLSVKGFVSIKIYDLSGREMASLVNTEQNAGYYEIKLIMNKYILRIPYSFLRYGSYSCTVYANSFEEAEEMADNFESHYSEDYDENNENDGDKIIFK